MADLNLSGTLPAVEFVSGETLANSLEGLGVEVEFKDEEGWVQKAGGVIEFVIHDDGVIVFKLFEVTRPDVLVVGSFIDNLTKITVL